MPASEEKDAGPGTAFRAPHKSLSGIYYGKQSFRI